MWCVIFKKGNMFLHVEMISGLMVGIEVLWDESVLVIDLGIIRVFIGKVPERFKK